MSNSNIVNPGVVNVADQAQAPFSINQTITVGPSTDAGPVIQAAGQGGRPSVVEQEIKVGPSGNSGPVSQAAGYAPGSGVANGTGTVTPAMTAGRQVNADLPSPTSAHVISTNPNTVIGQTYGLRAHPPTSLQDRHATSECPDAASGWSFLPFWEVLLSSALARASRCCPRPTVPSKACRS